MNAPHFTITQKAGVTYYRGSFCLSNDNAMADFLDISCDAFNLHLIPVTFWDNWKQLIRILNPDSPDYVFGLDLLCGLLSVYAAPGCEFTAWIIQGRKVWGWFPREG
jgi:hypothetical protein